MAAAQIFGRIMARSRQVYRLPDDDPVLLLDPVLDASPAPEIEPVFPPLSDAPGDAMAPG
jgi:hypothetical protein